MKTRMDILDDIDNAYEKLALQDALSFLEDLSADIEARIEALQEEESEEE